MSDDGFNPEWSDELADAIEGDDDELESEGQGDDYDDGSTWTVTLLANGNIEVVIETADGQTYHLGAHGGIDPDDLQALIDQHGEGDDLYDELDAWDAQSG